MREVKDWSDITIGQYQEMMLVESTNEITRFIECMAIALDCDPQTIRDMQMADYSKLRDRMAFISTEPKNEINNIIEVDGIEYGLEPDINLMTAGVFIDAEQFKQDPIVNLHNSVALIYRPVISKKGLEYQIEPHQAKGFEKRANLFADKLSIEVVLGATLFFSLLGIELSTNILEFLAEEMKPTTTTTTTQPATKKRKQKPFKKGSVSTTQSSE